MSDQRILVRVLCEDMAAQAGWACDWDYPMDLAIVEIVGWLMHVDDRMVRVASALQDSEDATHRDVGSVHVIPRSTILEVQTLSLSGEVDLGSVS